MAGVPFIFGNATTSIPLSNLDANFNTGLTIGNTTVGLGNTVTTLGNVTLTNATIVANTSSIAANAVVYTTSTGNLTGNASVFTVDSSGNVGIGTSSPGGYKLNVQGTVNFAGSFYGRNNNFFGASNASVSIQHYTTTNWNYANLNLWRNASNTSTPRFFGMPLDGDSDSNTTIGGYNAIWGAYDSSPTTGSTSSGLNGKMVYGAYAGHQWYTNGSERMRIDSSGNLLVGTTGVNYGAKLQIGFDSSAANGITIKATSATYAGSSVIFENVVGGISGNITNTATTTTYGTLSDYRLKENVQNMIGGLSKVLQLRPVTYTWKDYNTVGEGFIAHELQAIVPECVTGIKDQVNEDGSIKPQCLDTSFLVATLTAAIQELNAKVTALEAQLGAK